jgi:Domain of unknown function (DUF4452)
MASFYYGSQQHHPSQQGLSSSHNHHAGRSRRATRASAAHHHNHHHKQQMKALRLQQKEAEESALERAWAFRKEFEAARSFDFEDDEAFCPFNLLTDDDVSSRAARDRSSSSFSPQLQSMHSGSDRSSLSSGSPDHSPLQTQAHPSVAFLGFPSLYNSHPTPAQPQGSAPKLHQPLAQRIGKAIPIVDPSTRNVASPPPSVSPARQVLAQQFVPGASRRAW